VGIPRGIAIGVALAGVLWVCTGLYSCGADRARRAAAVEVRAAHIERENAVAAAEAQRTVYLDSVQLVARRAVQAEAERDRIDRALGWERRVTSTLLVVVAELRDSLQAAVSVDSADVRRASWRVRQGPWTADVDVAVPAPPDSATLRLSVALDPVGVTVRVGCGGASAGGGVRPAQVAVEGPPWAALALSGAVVSPDVCSPIVPELRGASRTRWFAAGAVAGAAGVLWLLR
jgi:hypothetical protein